MVIPRDFLAEALAALENSGEPSPRDRLKNAGMLFWHAYVAQGGHWSARSQARAGAILTQLRAGGQVRDTIAAMNDAMVRHTSDDLRDFIQTFDRNEETR